MDTDYMDDTAVYQTMYKLSKKTLNYLYIRLQLKPKQIEELMGVSIGEVIYALSFYGFIGIREEVALWTEYNNGN